VLCSCRKIVILAKGAVQLLLNAPATPPHSNSLVVVGISGADDPRPPMERAACVTPLVETSPTALRHHAGGGGPSEPGGALIKRIRPPHSTPDQPPRASNLNVRAM
jgi:hypothetical protein